MHMGLVRASCVLLALVAAVLGEDISQCDGADVTALRDTLRQSACRLAPGRGNASDVQAFRDYVFTKHGAPSSKLLNTLHLPLSAPPCLHRPPSLLCLCKPIPPEALPGVVPLPLPAVRPRLGQHNLVCQHRLPRPSRGDLCEARRRRSDARGERDLRG